MKVEKSAKTGMKAKRLRAGCDGDYLLEVFCGLFAPDPDAAGISVAGIDNGNNFCYNGLARKTVVDNMGILLLIKQTLPQLPDQELKVGDYVLRHPHEVMGYSITRLAEACGTSNTTVWRFCQRMGLDGYRQFRIALAQDRGSPENLTYIKIQPGDTLASVAQKMFAANIQALHETQEVLELEVLERLVDKILEARRVDFYAVGGAGIAAREWHFKCMQQGINANAFLDSQMQLMSAASLTPDDVGIAISHSGTQRHIIETLKLAAKCRATTAALTSYPDSPVAKVADLVLCTASMAASTSYDSPTVRNTQLAVVDVIYEAMILKGQGIAREKMARVAKAISGHATALGGEG